MQEEGRKQGENRRVDRAVAVAEDEQVIGREVIENRLRRDGAPGAHRPQVFDQQRIGEIGLAGGQRQGNQQEHGDIDANEQIGDVGLCARIGGITDGEKHPLLLSAATGRPSC